MHVLYGSVAHTTIPTGAAVTIANRTGNTLAYDPTTDPYLQAGAIAAGQSEQWYRFTTVGDGLPGDYLQVLNPGQTAPTRVQATSGGTLVYNNAFTGPAHLDHRRLRDDGAGVLLLFRVHLLRRPRHQRSGARRRHRFRTRGGVLSAQFGILWRDGQMINLGTLGGSSSVGTAINDHDVVAGSSLLTTGGEPSPGPRAPSRLCPPRSTATSPGPRRGPSTTRAGSPAATVAPWITRTGRWSGAGPTPLTPPATSTPTSSPRRPSAG